MKTHQSCLITILLMVTKLSIYFLTNHPQDSARILEEYTSDEVKDYLSAVSSKVAASIIQHMTPTCAVKCLVSLEPKKSAEILEKLGVGRHLDTQFLKPVFKKIFLQRHLLYFQT